MSFEKDNLEWWDKFCPQQKRAIEELEELGFNVSITDDSIIFDDEEDNYFLVPLIAKDITEHGILKSRDWSGLDIQRELIRAKLAFFDNNLLIKLEEVVLDFIIRNKLDPTTALSQIELVPQFRK